MTQREYNQTVDLYSDNVYRFILKNIKDESKAKDIVQEAWEKLWVNRSGLESAKAKSWLFTTAYRLMIDGIRKEKKITGMEELEASLSYAHERNYTDLSEVLEEALNRLPAIQKEVILLRDYEGYDYREIGNITGLKESQVKVYIFRARKALKQYLVSVDTLI